MKKKSCLLVLILALLFSCSHKENNDDQVTIRAWHFPDVVHTTAMVGKERGAFAKEIGDKVKIKWYIFNAGPSAIEAIFANEVDIGYIGPNPAINGYIKSAGSALRILAGSSSGGAGLVVRKDSGIKTAADFEGKIIATPQIGNTQDVACRSWLKNNKLRISENGGSIKVIPLKNPDQLTLFLKKEIDGAWTKEPWVSRLIKEGNGVLFLDERDIWPDGRFVTSHLVVRTKFLKEYPELVKKWVEAHVETTEWVNSNIEEAKKILADSIKKITGKALPANIIDSALGRTLITYDPVRNSLLRSAQNAFMLGFLGKSSPDLSFIYDLSILNNVLKDRGIQPVF